MYARAGVLYEHAEQQSNSSRLGVRLADLLGKRKGVADPTYIAEHECSVCKDERKRRCRVAHDLEVFKEEPFAGAPAVFANNDVKYDNNKKRAEQYANDKNLAMTFVPAKDKPSHDAIREKPGIAAEKLSWLQRHDKESGDLYGILPQSLSSMASRSPLLITSTGTHRNSFYVEKSVTFIRGSRKKQTPPSFRAVFAFLRSCPRLCS